MRLLKLETNGTISLEENRYSNIPPYAILSHIWGKDVDEINFKDLVNGSGKSKPGYEKIRMCGEEARKCGLQYFWVDTCCINKEDSAELQYAITSMFKWYQNAAICYVYLSDVPSQHSDRDLTRSRWFTRGWTLQELVAPKEVEFFAKDWTRLGGKVLLRRQIKDRTGIPIAALEGRPLSNFSIDERMLWAEGRRTKREEDRAYSLLGIFGVGMSLRYGEGEESALKRLRRKINKALEGKSLSLLLLSEVFYLSELGREFVALSSV